MKGIIVAAGRSSRLYPLTLTTPKCLLPFDTMSIIERAYQRFTNAGVTDIIVVTGYHHRKLRAAMDGYMRFVFNPFFTQTNNMASLWFALLHIHNEAFLYTHSDVVFSQTLVDRLLAQPIKEGIRLMVDYDSIDDEAMKVRIDYERFIESSKDIPLLEASGEWTGLAFVSASACGLLRESIEGLLEEQHFQAYDTAAFNRLAERGVPFDLIATDGLPWCEIDTLADLNRAKLLFEGRSDCS